jgi:hypothetical protein
MNGRLYDPVIGRFFSPDNFVQIPEFTQAFNRYSYCLNNPLKYIDPTGNKFLEILDNYGLDKNTGRLSLTERTNDKFDVIYTGSYGNDGKFTASGAEGSTLTVSKGVLMGRNFTDDLSKRGFSTTNGLQEEGVAVMKFISFQLNRELSAWGYRDKYDGLNELYINAWDKNTWNHSYKVEFNRGGKAQFLIHIHPGSKDGLGGFGRASEADYDFQSKTPVDYYILSRHHGLTGYNPKTRTDFTPTSNMVPQSLKLYIK